MGSFGGDEMFFKDTAVILAQLCEFTKLYIF